MSRKTTTNIEEISVSTEIEAPVATPVNPQITDAVTVKESYLSKTPKSKGVKIIRPFKKEPANARTLEGSLFKEGYNFVPGTIKRYYPKVDSRGVIRTGLDENSVKIRAIEDTRLRNAEYERVKNLRMYYESLLDESLEPTSTFYDEVKEFGYNLEDGDNIFNMDNPKEAVDFYWLMETEMVARSIDEIESGKVSSSIVRFYVYDGEVEDKNKFERKKRINSAIAQLDSMSPLRRKKIQKLIGLGLSNDVSEEVVYNAIDEYLRTSITALGLDPIENFNKINSLSEEFIEAKSLVRDLINYSIIRVKGSIVYEGEHLWAKSVEEFELMLIDPKYQDEYEAFKRKVKNKINIEEF
jgi:hypothetical protein